MEYLSLLGERGGGERVSSAFRILVLTGLVLFVIILGVGITLDYLIFRGLHPGTVLLPLGLACLAVFGITIGSILSLGTRWQRLLPETTSRAARNALRVFGAALAVGIAAYIATIAPYRSIAAGETRINQAQKVLRADEAAVPKVPAAVIRQDEQLVRQAVTNLTVAKEVDRLSAATLTAVQIPLAEVAVMGGELIMFDLARRRREKARRARQDSIDEEARADAQSMAELMTALVAHGHDETVIHQIRARLENARRSSGSQPPSLSEGEGPPVAPGAGF